MKIGNNYVGMDIHNGYVALFIFPVGFEIFMVDGLNIAFTLFGFEMVISFVENLTLFRD